MLRAAQNYRNKMLLEQLRTSIVAAHISGVKQTSKIKAVIFDMGGVIFPSPGTFMSRKLFFNLLKVRL